MKEFSFIIPVRAVWIGTMSILCDKLAYSHMTKVLELRYKDFAVARIEIGSSGLGGVGVVADEIILSWCRIKVMPANSGTLEQQLTELELLIEGEPILDQSEVDSWNYYKREE